MNDETRQCVSGYLTILSWHSAHRPVAGLSTWVVGGVSSPWFITVGGVADCGAGGFGLRRVSQLVVATYVLVLELTV